MATSRLRAAMRCCALPLITSLLAMLVCTTSPIQTVLAVGGNVTVNDTLDESTACATTGTGTCSLQDGVAYANAHAGTTLTVQAGTYTLSSGVLNLTNTSGTTTITGAGAATTIVDANNASRVFTIASGATVSITGLTIRNGTSSNSNGGNIVNNGILTLTETVVSGGAAPSNSGGGIFSQGGNLSVIRSTISGNEGFGAAIYNDCNGCTVTLTNSTISGNIGDGGGILNVVRGTMQLTHVTISGNTSGFGIRSVVAGIINVANSINTDNCTGNSTIASQGYNIDSGTTCGFARTGDQSGVSPNLGSLQDNGGPTPTMVPGSGSPAIDQIPNTGGCNNAGVTTDQRNVARPQPAGGSCDVGAVEVTSGAASLAITGLAASVYAGAPQSITVTAKDAAGATVTSYAGTITFTSTDGAATLPSDYAFGAGDNGAHTFTVTFNTIGSRSVTATDTTTASITGSASATVNQPPATVTVTTQTDSNNTCASDGITTPCSLRDAITFGNAVPGRTITVPAGTYTLTQGELGVTASMTINGASAKTTTIDGNNNGRVFDLVNGITVNISGLTMAHGTSGCCGAGGAIATMATLTITNSVISNSVASQQYGGAIFNGDDLGNGGVLTIVGTTINGNSGTNIIHNGSGNPIYITNSTITGNSGGEGILRTFRGPINATHVTLAENSGAGTYAFGGGSVSFTNSINTNGCAGNHSSGGYNIEAGTNCGFTATGDQQNTDPGLGALQYNGGTTQTMAIAAGSAAVDKIPNAGGCNNAGVTTDQRGATRPQPAGGLCDVGAYEFSTADQAAATLVVAGFTSPSTAGVAGTVTVTAKNGIGDTATTYVGTVHFTSSDPLAVLPGDYTFIGTDNGTHTFSVTLKTAGTQSITATDTATSSVTGTQSNIAVTPASAATLVVAGHASPVTAGTQGSVSVTARDAFGNTATGYTGTVTFTSSDAQAILPTNYTFTVGASNDNGVHTFTNLDTLKTAGTQSITATDTVTSSITGTNSGIIVTAAATSKFLVTGYPSPTQPNVSNVFTVIARDAYNNTTSGYGGTIHFTSDDAQATVPANYAFTVADAGVHTFSATLKSPGTRSITATDTVTSSITGSQSGITVSTGAASNATAAGGSPQSAVVGHAFTTALAVTVTDASSTPVSGVSVTFVAPASGARGTFSGSATATATTNGSGVATAPTFTAGTIAGSYTVSVIIPGGTTFNLFSLTNTPDVADHFDVTGSSSATAGAAFAVTVIARDASGNTATGYRGTVHFTSTDAQAAAGSGLPGNYPFDSNDNGTHTFTSGVTLKTAGSRTIAVADTQTSAVSGTLTVQVGAATASTLTASASSTPQNTRIGTAFATPLTAVVTDAYGNPVSDVQITFGAPGSGASGTFAGGVNTATTNPGGVATAAAFTANTSAGSYTVTASANGLTTVNFSLTNTPGAPGSISVSTGGTQSATVNAAFGTALAALVKDASNNPVPNVTVIFVAPVGGATGTFTGPVSTYTTTTNASGIATAPTFTANTTAGAYAVSASANGVATPATFSLTNAPGNAASLVLTGLPNPTTAGANAAFTLTAKDPYGNTATGYRGTVTFTTTDGAGTKPANYLFTVGDAGVHLFSSGTSFKTVGSQSLTATDTGNGALTTTQNTQVNPAAAASVVVANYPSPIAINTAAGFSVVVRDTFGNTASGYTGTLHFTSSDTQATLPTDYPFTGADQGAHSFTATLKTPGTRGITATDTQTSSITGSQTSISVVTVTANGIAVSAGGTQSATVHTAFGTALAATVTDSASNPVPNVSVTFTAPASGASGTFPGNTNTVNVTTNASGVATAPTFTANTIAGGYSVTASVNGAATPATFALANTPGAAATLVLGGLPNSVQVGTALNISLTAKDDFGNTATGYRGTVSFTTSDGAGTKPANYTFTVGDNGVHTFASGVSFKTLGTQSLAATDTGAPTITISQPVQIVPGPAATITLANFPATIAAGASAGFTVVARDAFGNTASGYSGTIRFTSSDGAATLPAAYTFTGADQGIHSFTATLRTPGAQSLTATDTATNSLTSTQSGITVTTGTTLHLALTAPASASAGTPFAVTVTVKDNANNTVPSYTRTIGFTSSDPQAILPSNYTFVAGDGGTHTFSITMKLAGSRTITVTDLGDGTLSAAAAVTVGGPTVSGLSPLSGPPAGGTTITITGTNLQGASVTMDGAACGNVQVNDPGTSLTCTVPGHNGDATVDVVVTAGGGTATLVHGFTYVTPGSVGPPAPRSSPNGGTTTGVPSVVPTGR